MMYLNVSAMNNALTSPVHQMALIVSSFLRWQAG